MDKLTVPEETQKTIEDFLESHGNCSFFELTRHAPYDRPHIEEEWQLNIVDAEFSRKREHSVELLYHCESEDKPRWQGVSLEYCKPRDAIRAAYPMIPFESHNLHFKSAPIR